MLYKGMVCQWCGATFTAQKSSTRFCSKRCASLANKQHIREMTQGIVGSDNALKQKSLRRDSEVLTPRLLADYLGVCRSTAYNYLKKGLFTVIQTGGKTFIRRADVDAAFDNAPPYRTTPQKQTSTPLSDSSPAINPAIERAYTTTKDVAEKYGYCFAGANKILQDSGITSIRHKNRLYYYQDEVEALFRKRAAESHPEITEWYTAAEIQEKYGLALTSVYDIASDYNIPRKKVHNVTYYSKIHFDTVRGGGSPDVWYTVQEAMAKYGQTRDQVYNVLRYNSIERVQTGRFVKFRRSDYDAAMRFISLPSSENNG